MRPRPLTTPVSKDCNKKMLHQNFMQTKSIRVYKTIFKTRYIKAVLRFLDHGGGLRGYTCWRSLSLGLGHPTYSHLLEENLV